MRIHTHTHTHKHIHRCLIRPPTYSCGCGRVKGCGQIQSVTLFSEPLTQLAPCGGVLGKLFPTVCVFVGLSVLRRVWRGACMLQVILQARFASVHAEVV